MSQQLITQKVFSLHNPTLLPPWTPTLVLWSVIWRSFLMSFIMRMAWRWGGAMCVCKSFMPCFWQSIRKEGLSEENAHCYGPKTGSSNLWNHLVTKHLTLYKDAIRLSMSALMGDPDPYPWVFFYLLLQPGSLKDLSYGLPIPMDLLPIGAWVPMGYSYRWILIGTYRYTYGYLYRGQW